MALNIDPSKFQRLTSKDIANSESMQVDWGSVASNLSKTLTDVRDDRERRKQEIQDRTDQAMQKLNEVPDLKNQTLLTAYYEGGDDAKNAMLTYYDQVKRGLAKTKDFKIFTGNVLTGFKGMSDSFKNFDGYYTDMMQKIKNGEVSGLTENAAESIESFASLKNKKIYTNPLTGQIQVVSMLPDKDGNFTIMPDPKKNPERFQNPMSVNSIMRFEEKRKVLLDEAKKLTDPLATVITASVNNGSVTSIEDFRQMDDIGGKTYDEWLSSQVNTLTANDSDIAQILSGQGYKFAGSAVEFKEKYPGLGLDKFIKTDYSSGSPVLSLTDGQKKRARGFAESAIESQLDSIVKKTQGFDLNRESVARRRDEDIDDAGYIRELNTIMTGNKTDAEAALKRRIDTKNANIKFEDDKIVSFDITDDQIILRRKKGDPFIIDRKQDTGVADDPTTPEDESINVLSTLDDIVSINDVLAPKPLSKGKIQDLVQRENITLGQRREEGVSTKTPRPEIEVFTPKSLAADGTSLSSYLIDKLDEKLKSTTSNPKIKSEIQKAIQTYMPLELSKDLNARPDLYGPTTVSQVDRENKFIITIGKESVEVTTDTDTSTAEIVEKVAEVINKAREKVNTNRTSGNVVGSQKLSFSEWRKENPGGTYADWKKTQ